MGEQTKLDRRSVKTQKVIWDAFSSLILEKGPAAVKVSDIVKASDINRGTFYLHYKDKYDLLEQMTTATLEDLRELLLQARRLCGADTGTSEIDHIFRLLMGYIQPRSLWFRAMLSFSGPTSFDQRARTLMADHLRGGYFATMSPGSLTVPLDYWVAYGFSANVGVIRAWLDSGCPESPEELAGILSEITKRGLFQTASIRKDDRKPPFRRIR